MLYDARGEETRRRNIPQAGVNAPMVKMSLLYCGNNVGSGTVG
jgi:hypothetical protein